MQDFRMDGVGKIAGGEYDTIRIGGVGSCSNSIKAINLHIEGVFNCSGEVDAGSLYCKGVANFKSNIKAKKMYVEGVFSESGGTKIEAEEIICEGVIKTGGEISTDILSAEGCIEADEIVGDNIKILSHNRTPQIIGFLNRIKSKIRFIEATTIELRGVRANTVNGTDITIGPNCDIENLDCSGTLYIDKNSFVRNVTGNFARRD